MLNKECGITTTTSGGKDIGIEKIEFESKNHFF